MMFTRIPVRRGLLVACGLSLSLATAVLAEPPTDAQIQAKIAALSQWQRTAEPAERTFENYQAKIEELLADVNIDELTLKQISMLGNMLMNSPAKSEVAVARLAQLAEQRDIDGAKAAVVAVTLSMRDREELTQAVVRALKHPAIVDAAGTELGSSIFNLVGYAEADALKGVSREVLALQAALTADFPPSALRGATEYLTALNNLGDAVSPESRAQVRAKVSGLFAAAIEKAKAEAEPNQRLIDSYENSLAFLNGAFARGELIDHEAPAMTFTWSSTEQPITGLEQFKGKVVVLDFWATWCGPCIASFPAIAEMVERYKDYDVVVLGVTSLQGRHYPGDGKPPVDCEGDPAKEYALMKEFMKDKKMTWEVAFTEENVFNPDYGVRGIPHVAIIDPEGKVRYNGLHPMAPKKEKAEKIDGLLKKAGLAVPAPIADDANGNGND